jgi:hypothetical protein
MENLIYSSNSNDAIFKDLGPYKQQSTDNSLFGFISFEAKQVTKNIVLGQRIEIAPEIINSTINDLNDQKKLQDTKEHTV